MKKDWVYLVGKPDAQGLTVEEQSLHRNEAHELLKEADIPPHEIYYFLYAFDYDEKQLYDCAKLVRDHVVGSSLF